MENMQMDLSIIRAPQGNTADDLKTPSVTKQYAFASEGEGIYYPGCDHNTRPSEGCDIGTAESERSACVQVNANAAGMKSHIFRSQKAPELFGFTADETGGNLPQEDGPWERAGNAIPLGTTMASTSPRFGRQIERDGYVLVKGHSATPRV
jgi:hypothetical protein